MVSYVCIHVLLSLADYSYIQTGFDVFCYYFYDFTYSQYLIYFIFFFILSFTVCPFEKGWGKYGQEMSFAVTLNLSFSLVRALTLTVFSHSVCF